MKQLDLFETIQCDCKPHKNDAIITNNRCDIVLQSSVKQDEYTQYIADKFDLHVTDIATTIIPNKLNLNSIGHNWNIGVICGASGSGKSTILRNIAKKQGREIYIPTFRNDICLISNFNNVTPQEATTLLCAMGLSSVPTWIRPYNVLSNGEQYRACMAKLICDANDDEIVFVDEFTSVVDRNVAKAMSNSLQKYIRRKNKKIILSSCHYDIFEWLQPDWIYDLNKGGALEKGDYLRRPQIELQVYRVTPDTWDGFKKYHYMTSELNKAASCFLFTWNEKKVAFVAVLPLPSGFIKNAFRGTRTVVLPDFQGFGIGSKITDFIGGIYKNSGKQYYTKTANPALGKYRENSPKWETSAKNGKQTSEKSSSQKHNLLGGVTRPSYCYKYVGEPIEGYEDLLLPIDAIRENKRNVGQLNIF